MALGITIRKCKTQQTISHSLLIVMLSIAFTVMLTVVMLNDVSLESSFQANTIFVSLAPLNAPLPGWGVWPYPQI
jgi:hypothetical protein